MRQAVSRNPKRVLAAPRPPWHLSPSCPRQERPDASRSFCDLYELPVRVSVAQASARGYGLSKGLGFPKAPGVEWVLGLPSFDCRLVWLHVHSRRTDFTAQA
jgi:hypothetical protein